MEELIASIHMHTRYSDGTGSHEDIGQAALKSGLDVVIVTDHNILVSGMERYYQKDKRLTLMLVGEEIHDQVRQPQKSHLLVVGAGRELSSFAPNPQRLLDQVQEAQGLAFIAHPYENALPLFSEEDISWDDWDVHGFTGIELWNNLSELKNVIHGKLSAIFFALFPQFMAHGPLPAALKKWDELTASGNHVVAIGGADAHALNAKLGPMRRTIFPYEFHFRSINNHLLTPTSLTGDLVEDRKMVLLAFRAGHAYIGYDLPASTRGFRFNAHGREQTVGMGDSINLDSGVTFQIRLPLKTECRLIKDGIAIKIWHNREIYTFIANQPGVYRVEVYLNFLGKKRSWIISNPIYIYERK